MEWVVFPINKIGWSTGSANVNLSCFTRISTEYLREKIFVVFVGHDSSLTWRWRSWVPRLFAGWYQMIIYGDDSTRSGPDRACVCLNNRVCAYCVRSKEVASFAHFLWNVQRLLSVCRLFSLVSFSRKKSTISTATVRNRWSSWLLTPSPLDSSSGSQAARHGRIPKPVLVSCSSLILAWIRNCACVCVCVLILLALFLPTTGLIIWKNISQLCSCSWPRSRYILKQGLNSDLALIRTRSISLSLFCCCFLFYWVYGVE